MKNLIEVKNLSKIFEIPREKKQTLKSHFLDLFRRTTKEKYIALDDINFNVSRGEFLGIIGRNGSGKSTLLKIIAGIYLPDSGSVTVNGKVVPFLELGVGFNPELSGRENIFLNGSILGMSRKFLQKSFDEIVDFAELHDFIDAPLKTYSSGMQVRLAFSIAIKAVADIYILDEILSVGDEAFQRKSIEVINKLKKEGKTIIFVSHDMNAIQKYCARAILLNDSKILLDGEPSKVIEMYHKLNLPSNKESVVRKSKTWGSGEASIKKVTLLGEKGEKSNVFTSEGNVTIKVDYLIKERLEEPPLFGIGIYRSDGVYISGTNSRVRKLKTDKLPSEGTLLFKFNKDVLLDGTYLVTVAIMDGITSEPFDYHSQMYPFEIRRFSKDHGLVSLPGEMRLKK